MRNVPAGRDAGETIETAAVRAWTEGGRMYKRAERVIPVPAGVAWQVMTDHAGYADVAENLSRVEVISGSGMGMRRRCYDNRGRGWGETCCLWEEGRAYSFEVHTSAADYPYPLRELKGTWQVEPVEEGLRVILEFVALPKWGFVGRTLMRLAIGNASRICLNLLAGWERRMLAEAGAASN